MIFLITICLFLSVLAMLAFVFFRVDTSSRELHPIAIGELFDAVSQDGELPSSVPEYSKIWSVVGGIRGLRELRRNAVLLTLDCARIVTDDPETKQEIDAMIRLCAAVNVAAVLGMLEAGAVAVMPWMPRSYAVDAAKNYCLLMNHWHTSPHLSNI